MPTLSQKVFQLLAHFTVGLALVLSGFLVGPASAQRLPAEGAAGDALRKAGPARGSPIRLPIEVLGREGLTKTVTFSLAARDVQQPLRLWMQVHSLSYENKGSIRFNAGAWLPLSNDTVTVEGLGKNFGGIGGAFATLKLNLSVPAGALAAGTNQLTFRFNTSDERSIGYRVLKFNLLRADGSRVLPDTTFEEDNPATWQPPLKDAASIAEGEKLWRTKQLVRSYKTRAPIRARCMDCHTQDGRDLKYFNYSNLAIIERAKFHGMTDTEAYKVASYIRALPGVPNPGRPWNPPYQPGPGLDSRPVEQWAAGAGVDAVLERDRELLRYMFPAGITKEAVATTANLSAREMPIYFQLPDWNHWLPSIHPKDAWGDAFVQDKLNTLYAGEGNAKGITAPLRGLAAKVRATGYTTYKSALYYPHSLFNQYLYEFLLPRYQDTRKNLVPDTQYSRKVYSTALWHMVKTWELMQEFGLEGQQRQLFPTSRETRGWMRNNSFDTSPNLLKLPRNNTGINNNSPLMFTYFSMAWYQLALILYNGNHSDGAARNAQRPIDWGYVYGFIKEMRIVPQGTPPNNALLTLWLVKGMQVSDNTLGPGAPGGAGWNPKAVADLSRLVSPDHMPGWSDITPQERTAILEALLSTWWDKTRRYPAADWWNGGGASKTERINGFYDGSLGNRLWYMLPQFKSLGVNPTLVNTIADWAQTLWPQADWSVVKNTTCTSTRPYVHCASSAF
ncbi:hypothetical protein [Vitiosangium sp. GDMCC 1.1324]|uniref:hypothetical protein n=1 Tax=Vitiosangium sp. (strain GDMCC 1.1324) TaxID=2138576 RepID=UPI000D3A7561|nr:hypothetical protein [Vitiosangium sp. GDMCC 1.1324]PTL75116.1 hypothetical protein DAT35_56440 [Vitiosangium sp. GDMCC 1.1324]